MGYDSYIGISAPKLLEMDEKNVTDTLEVAKIKGLDGPMTSVDYYEHYERIFRLFPEVRFTLYFYFDFERLTIYEYKIGANVLETRCETEELCQKYVCVEFRERHSDGRCFATQA